MDSEPFELTPPEPKSKEPAPEQKKAMLEYAKETDEYLREYCKEKPE